MMVGTVTERKEGGLSSFGLNLEGWIGFERWKRREYRGTFLGLWADQGDHAVKRLENSQDLGCG